MSKKDYDDLMFDCMLEEFSRRHEREEKLYEYLSEL